MNAVRSCTHIREEFSAYLDGAVTGVEMTAIAAHLDTCADCAHEFASLRSVQQSLADLGPAQPPERLQAHIRATISLERERGTHLSLFPRMALLWDKTIAPLTLRLAGAAAVAVVLLGGLGWIYSPLSVFANDDALANLVGPRYLYSQVPPQPIETRHDVPIVVEAKVDSTGRVYDYTILEGPRDESVEVRVQENLLASVFKPATVFGVPVRGHVLLTYTGVSVHG